jgi:hypothetical protein
VRITSAASLFRSYRIASQRNELLSKFRQLVFIDGFFIVVNYFYLDMLLLRGRIYYSSWSCCRRQGRHRRWLLSSVDSRVESRVNAKPSSVLRISICTTDNSMNFHLTEIKQHMIGSSSIDDFQPQISKQHRAAGWRLNETKSVDKRGSHNRPIFHERYVRQ